jgi:4-amino-4-deoxy-L-arabinose transferase-like glycosyltransferase
LGLAFLYVSKDWSGYSYLPGGRKAALGLLLVAGVGLLAGRVLPGTRWPVVRQALVEKLTGSVVRHWLPVGLLVAVALVLRVWGTNFGLPYLEHVDEWNVAERALHMVQTGNFDPLDYLQPGLADNDRQAFTYPTLTTYLETGVFAVRFLQGVAADKYDGTNVLASPYIKGDFYLWGRALVALLGAGTVLLVFLLGRRVYNYRVGLVGAAFLTFFYLQALNSHYLTTDVPSGFMVLLPFFWILPILEGREERRFYLLAGFLAGLAVATKYNNALILLPLVLAHLFGRPPRRWVSFKLPLAFLAAGAGFFVGAPFVFFHLPQFFTDLAAIINHYQNIGHPGFESNDNWLQYVNFMLADNLVIVWLGLAGVLLALVRHTRRDFVLLSFPLLTYLQLSSYKVNFSRNLMPVIPFLVIFAALALVMGLDWLWHKFEPGLTSLSLPRQTANLALGLVVVTAVVSPALTIWHYDSYNSQPTNRARATTWIEANIPHGAKLWLEPFSTDLLPRSDYRLEGGKGVLSNPLEWYAANGFHYIVLSEAYYKEALESGNSSVRASYRALTEGPYPAGLSLVQDFKKNETDRPGARIIILKTGLPLLVTPAELAKEAQPLALDFSGQLKLVGYQAPTTTKAGQSLTIGLYWQTLKTPGRDYTTFLHLLNSDGKIVAQVDLPPFAGTRPTSTWQPGQLVRDEYPLSLPGNLPAGQYRVVVGLYLPDGPRLNLADGRIEADMFNLEVTGAK